MRHEMVGHLRLHAKLRRAQGYDVQELLAEFDGLSRTLGAFIEQKVAQVDSSVQASDAVAVLSRLAAGTRALGFVTTGLYRESESEFRSRLARELENFGRALAHELKTPLQTVSLSSSMLRDKLEDDPAHLRDLAAIDAALDRTQQLLQDIKVLAMAQRTAREAESARFDLVVRSVFDELQSLSASTGVQLEADGDLPQHHVDRSITQLCLVNLVHNSIEYHRSDEGRSWVRVSATADETPSGPRLRVWVRDNGVGIAPELLPHVFQRQFRGHPELAEGVGLGLAIAKELIEEQAGTIELTSEVDVGTCVEFQIRAERPEPLSESKADFDIRKLATEHTEVDP